MRLRLRLEPGRVYRTEDLGRYDSNPTRLAGKLVRSGLLRQLRKGVYYAPEQSAFGEVPPSEAQFLKSLFRGRPYLRTGPSVWNTLGLGATAVEAVPLVYNTTRTGIVQLGGRQFEMRRVQFPRKPPPEYFVVDLLENLGRAGADAQTVHRALAAAVKSGRFDAMVLREMASRYAARATQKVVEEAIQAGNPVTA